MELRHLRYFVAVAKNLNFTKAADSLHISQPPLSRQIQEFEEEVGVALFERQGKKITLTEAGEYLLVEAERILEGIEVACRTAKAIADKARPLNIGCVNFFLNSGLAPFLEKVREQRPELRMEILVMSTDKQKRALLSGAIDLGFVRSWIDDKDIAFEPVVDEPLALVFPVSYEIKGDAEGCMAAVASRPYIGITQSAAPGLFHRITALCLEYGFSPTPAFECNDAFSIIGMVSSGLGWSIVPNLELVAIKAAGLGSVPLRQKTLIGICYRPAALSADAGYFIEHARKHFAWSRTNSKPAT